MAVQITGIHLPRLWGWSSRSTPGALRPDIGIAFGTRENYLPAGHENAIALRKPYDRAALSSCPQRLDGRS